MNQWKTIQNNVKKNGLTFMQGLRLLHTSQYGYSDQTNLSNQYFADTDVQWFKVQAGKRLKETLNKLRSQNNDIESFQSIFDKYLFAKLRSYQLQGVNWLWMFYNLKLGGCLADDMGLGKTIQIISLLLLIKYQKKERVPQVKNPHLLVVPASLLNNWQSEIIKFAPDLSCYFLHPSFNTNTHSIDLNELKKFDIVITTYSHLYRLSYLSKINWDLIILDEAQVIKNPTSQQTCAAKNLKSNVRFILTGTPIENRLKDLWSLFDFFAPGLLGSLKEFGQYSKNEKFNDALRNLTAPYILRRLKSDKNIISDLPDKIELTTFCNLSKKQAILYEQSVKDLKDQLKNNVDAINRKGIIFSYLLRFKQICNHPCQWLGYGQYDTIESGKFLRLIEICQNIYKQNEKVLIFTQFQEIIPSLNKALKIIFGQEGLMLHGGTPIKKRAESVKLFAQENGPKFFIISLKAGGTGLNLINASNVIHFDRWWNPAVENQATDRAYRIGQKNKVMVYKFICQGTIEEKIDQLILQKKSLSSEILESEENIVLTQLSDDQLIDMVSLDIHKACEDV